MKGLPKILDFKTRTAIIFDGFNSRKIIFINPVYEFSWAMYFVGDFLDLLVKECTFSAPEYLLELLPILNIF